MGWIDRRRAPADDAVWGLPTVDLACSSMTLPPVDAFEFVVDGAPVLVDDERLTLLDVLRDRLGVRSVKDGCSPQGQCGCCTVLVEGN